MNLGELKQMLAGYPDDYKVVFERHPNMAFHNIYMVRSEDFRIDTGEIDWGDCPNPKLLEKKIVIS